MLVDEKCYELAKLWFEKARSQRGYTKEDVQELAEQFQQAAEDAVRDDDDEE